MRKIIFIIRITENLRWYFQSYLLKIFDWRRFPEEKIKAFKNVKNKTKDQIQIGRGKHFRKRFWSYLKVKSDCLRVQMWYFSFFFCRFLSYKVETVFKESKSDSSKRFHFKVWERKYFGNRFWSYLEVKNKCSEDLKMKFSIFLIIFQWSSWNCFWEKQGKAHETV